MLSNFKDLVKRNESDILLTITIILVALVSFGSGLLIDFSKDNQSIIIQNPEVNQGVNQASIQQASQPIKNQSIEQGRFVGSVNSNKYHWPECSFAKRIAEQNQIWFESEEEAQKAGYARCSGFEKYGP